MQQVGQQARQASRILARASTQDKNNALIAMAAAYASGNPSFNTVGSLNLPTSIDMLQITNAFMGAYQSEVSDAIEDVYSEMEDFQDKG